MHLVLEPDGYLALKPDMGQEWQFYIWFWNQSTLQKMDAPYLVLEPEIYKVYHIFTSRGKLPWKGRDAGSPKAFWDWKAPLLPQEGFHGQAPGSAVLLNPL